MNIINIKELYLQYMRCFFFCFLFTVMYIMFGKKILVEIKTVKSGQI